MVAFYEVLPRPAIIFPEPALTGYYEVSSGQIAVFPFALAANGRLDITLVHQIGTQDFALRAWVSTDPYGISVVDFPNNVTFWHPNRIPNKIVTVYDHRTQRPDTVMPLPIPPGSYYLNVQNLENRRNVFYLLLTFFQ